MKRSAWRAPTPVRWKGNFQVPGLGLAHVRTEQNTDDEGRPQITFNVDCHGIEVGRAQGVPSGHSRPREERLREGGGLRAPEQIVVELENRAPPTFKPWSNKEEPGQLLLAGSYPLEPLQKLAGGAEGGLDFYLRLESLHHTKFINKDGQAGMNFAIDRAELGLPPARQDQ
jgi:hypothetical protein